MNQVPVRQRVLGARNRERGGRRQPADSEALLGWTIIQCNGAGVQPKLKKRLSGLFDVFLPQEDGELIGDLIDRGMPVGLARMTVFQRDMQAIRDCHILLILLDGRVIDEGAAFELGAAFVLGKECWGLKTDARRLLLSGDNPMIEGALKETFSSVEELVAFAEVATKLSEYL